MSELRFALFGAGFWSTYQLAAWNEIPGVKCVAIYNRTLSRAKALAEKFGVAAVYDDPAKLLANEKVDFVDIVTGEETHAALTLLAARHKLPVICQKPMARSYEEAKSMVDGCRDAGVPLFIHENWRFQSGVRAFGEAIRSGVIGKVYRARIDMRSGFPVFKNQPFLATIEKFILTDLGSHTLDAARWMFGEADSLYCITHRIHPDIKGEDSATLQLRMGGTAVQVNMSYAENHYEVDQFPETFAFAEGPLGSAELGPNCTLRITTAKGTVVTKHPPPYYTWADARYAVAHTSIVPCHAQFVRQLRGEGQAETTGEDNLKTVELVFAAYESAEKNKLITWPDTLKP
ncbi:MAG: Gfo/Idh/MocA family oxidoreductase [Opitutaceae bacterium]|nr:Gfo/Idh/MocA family oxidoreductase [Opitutaceae bacterium]